MASWQTWVKGLLEKTAKRWPVWFGLTAVAGAAAFLLLPEVRALDLRIGFGPEEGHDVLTALEESGRRAYAYYFVADVAFLLAYTWFGVNATFAVFEGSRWEWLIAVPRPPAPSTSSRTPSWCSRWRRTRRPPRDSWSWRARRAR
ncbi:hypothetical protein ACFQV2_21670 [Actinokineospora soli]|uniref:Uncharacterized protein n=1 Tax=Actinokineospora soli TaxID=1048753 RepID=A0ABW2TPU6_9PSEU